MEGKINDVHGRTASPTTPIQSMAGRSPTAGRPHPPETSPSSIVATESRSRTGATESVLPALQLSHEKWGSIAATGNEQYKNVCAELAAEHGFKIVNPALRAVIGALRQARTAERKTIKECRNGRIPNPQ